jgi:excisionase family DNA binding protein
MQKAAERISQATPAEQPARFRDIPKLNYSIPEAVHAANIGRSTLYEAIANGELRSVKVGKRRLVPVDALKAWLSSN